MNIKPISQGNNKYCGPAVISAVTGISTDEAEQTINAVRNRDLSRSVTGVYQHELNLAFESLGWKVYHIPRTAGRSIYLLMMTMNVDGVYVFYLHTHVVVIEIKGNKRYIIDNHTKSPLNLSSSARLGQKVLGVVKLERNL